MGFGTVVANVVMFISVLLLATGTIVVFKNVIEDQTASMKVQSDAMSNNIKTNMEITSAAYDNVTEVTTIYVLNSGKTSLDVGYLDVYLDDLFVPRNATWKTLGVESSTHIRNPGYFDPNEILEITLTKKLQNNSIHTVAISGQYGNKEESLISMPE